MKRRVVIKWARRVIVWGLAAAGIYFAVYFWARMSGKLRNDWGESFFGDRDRQLRLCWAPGGICEHAPYPAGESVLVAAFRPAAAVESMAPEFFKSILKPESCRDFRGRFSEKEARRFVRMLLGYPMEQGAAFAGGEFDSSANIGMARFLMSEGEFRQWFGPIYKREEYDLGPRFFYERYNHRTAVFGPAWTNTTPRQSVWWKDGVTYVREDYGRYTPDLEMTRLEP